MKKLFSILLIATCAFATVKAEGTEDRRAKTVCPGTQVIIKAEAKTGYVFKGWTTDASSQTPVTTENPYTITNPQASVTYYALWELSQYKVWYKVNPNDQRYFTTDANKANPAGATYGGNHTIDETYFVKDETTCAEITGYDVYPANADGTIASTTAIFTVDFTTNPNASLEIPNITQDIVIIPVVDHGPAQITITIVSDDNSKGTVSFVDPDSGNTNQQ